jgi:hypothetical protein
MTDPNVFSASEIARYADMQTGAVYAAIRTGKLKAYRKNSHWYITISDFLDYRDRKYSREYSTHEGKPLYDREKGEMSINDAAKIIGISYGATYGHCKSGRLPYKKKGSAYVIDMEELKKFLSIKYPKTLQDIQCKSSKD